MDDSAVDVQWCESCDPLEDVRAAFDRVCAQTGIPKIELPVLRVCSWRAFVMWMRREGRTRSRCFRYSAKFPHRDVTVFGFPFRMIIDADHAPESGRPLPW